MIDRHSRMGGFVNAHTHIYSALSPFGMPTPATPPADFLEILERVWWRLDRALDERSLRAAARLYLAEALLHGTTVLVDHHESPAFIDGSLDVIADTCEELGLRAVVCYGATERNGGRDEARRGLEENRRFVRSNRRRLVKGVVGLHASFTVSDETIAEAGALCRELGTVLHVHVAEDGADAADAIRRGYAGPLERLESFGGLPYGSILAHGVHLNAAQVGRACQLGCWIVQNPRSNRANRVGYPQALSASQRVALGTDGFVSDMRVEQAMLAEDGSAHGEERSETDRRAGGGLVMAAELWRDEASQAGGDVAGTCVIVDGRVESVIVAGRTIVKDGRLQTGDIDAIRAEAREAAPAVWTRMMRL